MVNNSGITYIALEDVLRAAKHLPDPNEYRKPFFQSRGLIFRRHLAGRVYEWVIDGSIVVNPKVRNPR